MANLNNLKRDAKIAGLVSSGMTQRDAAKAVGLSGARVTRVLQDKQIKELLTGIFGIYAAHAKGIAKGFLKLCYDTDNKIRLDAIKEYHKIMGLSPSHATNQFLVNVYNDNRVQTVNPGVLQALGGNLSMLTGQDEGAQDAEHEDIEDE